jgi:hypothetical protein
MSGKALDKSTLARQLGGIWEKRKDLQNIDIVVRELRKGKRINVESVVAFTENDHRLHGFHKKRLAY